MFLHVHNECAFQEEDLERLVKLSSSQPLRWGCQWLEVVYAGCGLSCICCIQLMTVIDIWLISLL